MKDEKTEALENTSCSSWITQSETYKYSQRCVSGTTFVAW